MKVEIKIPDEFIKFAVQKLKECGDYRKVDHGTWLEKEVFHDYEKATIQDWQSARCSVCYKYHTTPYMYYFNNYNYCPNCGADMRGAKNE